MNRKELIHTILYIAHEEYETQAALEELARKTDYELMEIICYYAKYFRKKLIGTVTLFENE